MQIPFPSKGVSDITAASRQAPLTTARAQNVRLLDPWTGSLCGSQRSGQAPHSVSAIGAGTKIKLLADLVYDGRVIVYTALGDSVTQDWAISAPSVQDALNVVTDKLGNIYFLDGAAIVKTNADGQQQWKISLPAVEPGSTIRALFVDEQFRVFAGVSAGSDPKKAKLWAYEQLEKNKTALLWELVPGWFTETIIVPKNKTELYAAQNDTLNWKSRVALYTGLDVPNPTLARTWDVAAYPINDMDVSAKDSSVALTHEPNTARGNDPRSPETTGPLSDATLEEIIPSYKARAWCYLDSEDVDGNESFNSEYDDGDEVEEWIDKTGNDRNAYAREPDLGPVLRKAAVAGKDATFFDGATNSMQSEAGLSIAFQYRQLNKTLIPCHTKAQFVVVMVVRLPLDSTLRVILGQPTTSSTTTDRMLMANATYNGGSIAAPGNILAYEQSAAASGASGRAAGGNVTSLPGPFDADGLVLLSWIHDGGYDDVTSVPTRSGLRVNGRPADKWQSDAIFANLNPTTLGWMVHPDTTTFGARFQGDILSYFCLSDWYTTGFGQTSAFLQQRLITTPIYPDSVWSANGDTELERLEAFFAHKKGMAHKLPTGNAAILDALAVGTAGDTITIDGHVYTLRAAPAVTADEVKIGASAFATLTNLMHAINGTGTAGTDYGSATVRHASVWSPGVVENGNTAARPDLFVQRRDARITTTFATTESTAGARFAWLNGGTSVTNRNGSGRNAGHYPHPFFLYKTAQSPGGPPRTVGVLQDSLQSGLISPYGIVSIWDPSNGKLKGILTTAGPGYASLPFGGIGYGVRWNSTNDLYVCGPRQAAVTSIGISAENTDVRKLVWIPSTGFVSTDGTTALLNWSAAPGAFTYHFPRMVVDKWDNVYVPISAAGTSAKVYRRIAPGGLDTALIYSVTNITDDPSGCAIALDTKYPDYPTSFTDKRAERFYLGTLKASTTNTVAVYAVREITSANTTASPRMLELVAVVGTGLYKVVAGGPAVTIDATAFDTNARFIDSAHMNGARFFTDGTRYYVYDPRNSINGAWRAREGQITPRAMLMERFGSRIAIAGFSDKRAGLALSKYGDAYGWDFDPQGDSPLTVAAISSELSNLGDFPDVITCLASFRDDLALVGGDHSLSVMRGDPAQGGRFDELVKGIGVAFGRARCFTPDGVFWWLTNQAELYRMRIGENPERVSDQVQRQLADSIDFSVARPELIYDPNERCIRIFQMVNGTPSALLTHWTFELDTGQLTVPPWPDTFGALTVQPTAACLIDGDGPNDRVLVFGGSDGKVRKSSRTAVDDDGVRIASEVFCHLPVDNKTPSYVRFSNLTVMLNASQYGAQYEFYATQDPNNFGLARVSGNLEPGRNGLARVRQAGSFCGVLIKGSETHEKWALDRITVDAKAIAGVRS